MGGWIGGKGILPWPCSEDDEVARPLPGEDTNGVTVAEELPVEPTVARNVAEIDTRKPAEEAPAKLKKFGADELAELAAVKPTVVCSDKPMDVDAFVPEDEGIALKPAGEVSLDVEDAPSPSGSHKALGPASPSSLPSGEVASGSHKTVSASLKPKVNDARKNKVKLALPASCSKTPLPASGKGKEVAVVPKLSEASAKKTEQKIYRSN
ncbi:hypothetical protein E2562_014546 [Oryza meyeriana var. granulata]|uniref:Uncharacterized protein n=1 Tax=Oryza meyeriana var. granulata TaxID=110450 RepID=A0A6G1EK09_9ORYZ|nr:hypothetical protein E2562_014546 [Oryza meyeriana var. granulata]